MVNVMLLNSENFFIGKQHRPMTALGQLLQKKLTFFVPIAFYSVIQKVVFAQFI